MSVKSNKPPENPYNQLKIISRKILFAILLYLTRTVPKILNYRIQIVLETSRKNQGALISSELLKIEKLDADGKLSTWIPSG